MQRLSKIKSVCVAAVAAVGWFTGLPGSASAAPIEVDIHLGKPKHHPEVIVLEYEKYCVGFRANLYEADWRLRNAQIEQWQAHEALEAARQRQGEIAVVVESSEATVAEYAQRVADSDAILLAARAAVGRAAEDAADARLRLTAYSKRVECGRLCLEAGRILHEEPAIARAENEIRVNQALVATAATDLRSAEARVAQLQAAEANAAALNDVRLRLADAQAHLPQLREDLVIAHEAVYAAQQRLDAVLGGVALALHDRDEALWMLHRDEILTGRATLVSCGFTVDLGVWGGHMPRNPEVVHAYFVHPVAYWVERPVEIQTRVIEVEKVTEITHVRQIQVKHEGPRYHEVVRIETAVPLEERRAYAEHVVVERQHLIEERTERTIAVKEHRAPRLPEHIRVEAKAVVVKAHAEGHSEKIEAARKAHIEEIKAKSKKGPHDPRNDPK